MTTLENRYVSLKSYIPKGVKPAINNFDITPDKKTFSLKQHEFICQTMYLSVDPVMRFQMTGDKDFPSFELNKPLYGTGCGRVIESQCPEYRVGDIITTFKKMDWPAAEYVMWNMSDCDNGKKMRVTKEMIDDEKLYPTLQSVLGMTGMTAYLAVYLNGKPESGKTMVVSGACGAVGHITGQLAKNLGLRVIGVTSSKEKEDVLINELGFDGVVIYKNKSKTQLTQEFKEKCPDGVDYFVDNVGGDISIAVVNNMNQNSRYVLVGQISQYNHPSFQSFETQPNELENIIKERRVQKESFIVAQKEDMFEEGFNALLKLLKEGKIKHKETIYEGIEKWPEAFVGLFEGDNIGKSLIHVEPRKT